MVKRTSFILMIAASSAIASTDSNPLYNLSGGSKLVVKQPIVIRANNIREVLTQKNSENAPTCYLRAREPKPYDRLIRADKEFTVHKVRRAGFAAKHKTSTTTYVILQSQSIQDLVCSSLAGGREPTIQEFKMALRPRAELRFPEKMIEAE